MAKKGAKETKQIKPKEAKKLVEDQMFGMKNKNKSEKLKKLASSLENSYLKTKKKQEERAVPIEERYEILQIVPAGVDPKTAICVNFKNKACSRGDRCPFSHEQQKEKRTAQAAAPVQQKKSPKKEEVLQREEKICKFYIEQLKNNKHTPNWTCPLGKSCPNKHSPPEGYAVKGSPEAEEITIEEYIENEREKLPEKQTPMTDELFLKWRQERKTQKEKEEKEKEKIREGNLRLGKIAPTGKDLFVFKPDIFVDDEEALECDYNAREEDAEDSEEEVAQGIKGIRI